MSRFSNKMLFLSVSLIAMGLVTMMLHNRVWVPTDQPVVVTKIEAGGTNFAVVQFHQGIGLYNSSFFVGASNSWRWYYLYLDHDTGYWWNAKLRYQTSNAGVAILRGKRLISQFDPSSGLAMKTPKGFVSNSPIGSIEGDLIKNWNQRKYFP